MPDEPTPKEVTPSVVNDPEPKPDEVTPEPKPDETPPPEEKPEDKPDEKGEDKKEEENELTGAPESYEDFTLPEGVEMDKVALEEFTPLAKELDLSQKGAQKLIDFKAKNDARVNEESVQRQWDVWNETQENWVKEAKSDKEIGGDKFDESLSLAKKAIDAYGNQEMKDLLDSTGAGNHKEFIRFLSKVGKDVSEDRLRVSGSTGDKDKDRASRIYDKTPQ